MSSDAPPEAVSPRVQPDRARSSEPERDPSGSGREILLQGFNWESHTVRDSHRQPGWLAQLTGQAVEIAESGITAVWLPPPCQAIAEQGYMPQDLDSLNTAYGSEADLRKCLAALRARNVKSIADIVINHRCAQEKGPDGKWNQYTGRYAWDVSCIVGNQAEEYGGTGAIKREEVFEAAPNIDHSNARVRSDLKQWLSWLRADVGFQGLRFDFAKGYAGSYVKEYVEATAPAFVVGEFWTTCAYDDKGQLQYDQDAHRQQTVDWCDATEGTAAAFDFTTKGVLQEALEHGQFWRLRDGDGSTQGHWPFPAAHLQQGYVYIMTHPGTPCVFYDHLFAGTSKRGMSVWGSLKRLLSAGSMRSPLQTQPSRESISSQASGTLGSTHSGNLGSAHNGHMGHAHSGGQIERMSSSEASHHGATKGSRAARKQAKAANSPAAVRNTILDLIQLRRRARLHCRSQVSIVAADASLYAATIDGVVAMKLGPGSWCPDAGGLPAGGGSWVLACSGLEWAVWELQKPSRASRSEGSGRSASRPIPMKQ